MGHWGLRLFIFHILTVPGPKPTGPVLPGQVPTYLGPRLHGYGGRRLRWYASRISVLLYTELFFTSDLKRRPTAVMRFTAMTEITIVWATV